VILVNLHDLDVRRLIIDADADVHRRDRKYRRIGRDLRAGDQHAGLPENAGRGERAKNRVRKNSSFVYPEIFFDPGETGGRPEKNVSSSPVTDKNGFGRQGVGQAGPFLRRQSSDQTPPSVPA
jgi:hypothetical protein